MRLDRRFLGWGAFFIVLGAIPLAVRGGYLDRDLVADWPRLWPLILIGWGISLLGRRTVLEWLGGAVSTIAFGIMGGGLIATGWGGVPFSAGFCGDQPGTPFEARSGSFGTSGSLGVELGCGEMTVRTVDGSEWRVEGSDDGGVGPQVDVDGDQVSIRARDENFDFSDFGRDQTSWTVSVPREPTLELGVTQSAGDATLILDGAHLQTLGLTLNAGSMDLDASGAAAFGGLNGTVNAGAAMIELPSFSGRVNLTVNAGSLDVCVPADVAIHARTNAALGSHNLDGLGLRKVGDDTWESADYGSAVSRVEINVSASAGSFALKIGGSCGA